MAIKVNLKQVLKDLSGKPIKDGSEDGEDLTLKTIICNSLGGGYQEEKGVLKPSEVTMRYSLSVDIFKANSEIELTSNEVELIKKLVVKAYPQALISGQAISMIDPPPKDRKPSKPE